MISLFVGSTFGYAGKTLVSLGLGRRFRKEGINFAYFKPLGRIPVKVKNHFVDQDALFMHESLGLSEPLSLISPVVLTEDLLTAAYDDKVKHLKDKVLTSYKNLSRGKDLILTGGSGSMCEGLFSDIGGLGLVKRIKAKVILVDRYEKEVNIDCLFGIKERIEKDLIGVILNHVPPERIDYIKRRIVPFLKRKKIEILGIIPRDILLSSVSVGELAETLGGEIISGRKKAEELVEHFSIGAMNIESALKHFRKVRNKAVITGGDRSDIHLAALETSTKCLILTGNLFPNEIIIARAEEVGVPIILIKDDTLSTVERIEATLSRLRLRGKKKIKRALELVNGEVNFPLLYNKLGMK